MIRGIQSHTTLRATDPDISIEVTEALLAKLADTDMIACYLVRDIGEDRSGEFFVPRGKELLLHKPVLEPWRFTFRTNAGGTFAIEARLLLDRKDSVHPLSLVALCWEVQPRHEWLVQQKISEYEAAAARIDSEARALQAQIDLLYAERSGTINANLGRLGASAESRVISGYTNSERIKELQND